MSGSGCLHHLTINTESVSVDTHNVHEIFTVFLEVSLMHTSFKFKPNSKVQTQLKVSSGNSVSLKFFKAVVCIMSNVCIWFALGFNFLHSCALSHQEARVSIFPRD